MNALLRRALVDARRPFYETARLAGLSRTVLHHLVLEFRPARPEEKAALSRVLGVPASELFPSDPDGADERKEV